MIRIETFFKNHFDTERISNDRFRNFVNDHINKLTAKLNLAPNATLQQMLDDTLPFYNGFFGAINSEEIKFAVQQGRTIAVDNAWSNAHDFIRQKEGIVRGTWGKDSDVYQEFYPLGLEEYNQATNQNKITLLTRYEAAAISYQVDLGAAFVTQFTNLKTTWDTRFNIQRQQIALVKDAASQRETSRNPLELQMMRNMLGIAILFPGNVNMVNDFFNQSLLEYAQYDLPKEGLVNPGETVLVTDLVTYDPDEELEVENVSGGAKEFGFSLDGINIVGNTITIAGVGKEKMRVGNSGVQATKVMVRSQGTLVGKWRVGRG
jgi:hypothetical protein